MLPSGAVTFMFTDIEGSSKLWQDRPEEMRHALSCHDALMRSEISRAGGSVFKTLGDAFFSVFNSPLDALYTAISIQRKLSQDPIFAKLPIRVRIAIHTGIAEERDQDYFGPTLNRAARLLNLGAGGQTLVSNIVRGMMQDTPDSEFTLLDLGIHRLKDLIAPEQVWQVNAKGLSNDFPPLKSHFLPSSNLPRQRTPFIGRKAEIESIKALLKTASLLTLTGTGGTGKTRLSLQAAAELQGDYPAGVFFVDLSRTLEPGFVVQRVVEELGIREVANSQLIETVIERLRTQKAFILLDNCEHLIDECAHFVDALLRDCPNVTLLATSREPLNIPGEIVWKVPSLSFPKTADIPSTEDFLNKLESFDSCRLFIDRATSQNDHFRVTRENMATIMNICRRLDGIPMALELAAANVNSLSLDQIASHLGDRFNLLAGGNRLALPRQQTLRALIDWSYDLLGVDEKKLLYRLSLFAGGWTLKAAKTICSDESLPENDIVGLMQSLVKKSMVNFEDQKDGEGRYWFLESIREYCVEKSQGEDPKRILSRHRSYFLEYTELAESKLQTPEQTIWLGALDQDQQNIRFALSSCLNEAEDSEFAMRFCAGLLRYWYIRGHLTEGRNWLHVLLQKPDLKSNSLYGKVVNGAGILAMAQGDFDSAFGLVQKSLLLHQESGDIAGVARAYNSLGLIALERDQLDEMKACHEKSLELYRSLNDRNGIASNLSNLGLVAHKRKDFVTAMRYHEESLLIEREIGDVHHASVTLHNLGVNANLLREHDQALSYCTEALLILENSGPNPFLANIFVELAATNVLQSKFERGLILLSAATAFCSRQNISVPKADEAIQIHLDGLFEVLGQENYRNIWTIGQGMQLKELIEYSLTP